MPIIIISTGRLPKDQTYEATCTSCTTIFTFQREEALAIGDNRDGSYMEIACPLEGCGKMVTVAMTKPNYGR